MALARQQWRHWPKPRPALGAYWARLTRRQQSLPLSPKLKPKPRSGSIGKCSPAAQIRCMPVLLPPQRYVVKDYQSPIPAYDPHLTMGAHHQRLSSVADSLASLSERIKSRAAAAGDKDTASTAGSSTQGAGATEQSQPLLPLVTAAQAYHVAYEAPRKRLTLKGPTTEGGRAVVREAKVADFATLVLAPTVRVC